MEEIKDDEAKNGYIRVHDRAELGANVYNYRPPLDSVVYDTKYYSDIFGKEIRDEDFASFFNI